MIEVEFLNKTSAKIDRKIFRQIARCVEQAKKLKILLVFLNDAEMRKLNMEHRGKPVHTDVLSFSYIENRSSAREAQNFPHACTGEIFISVETASRQARNLKHSLSEELTTLFIHGLLHIFGYDHEKIKDAEEMERAAMEIRRAIKSAR